MTRRLESSNNLACVPLAMALSLLAAAPAQASQGSALPCSGYWAGEMRGPHGRVLDRAQVEMQFVDCGRSLHIYTNGETRQFARVSRTPNTYQRTETQGGFKLVVDYVQRTPRHLDVRWNFNGQATHPGSLTWLRPLPAGTMALLAAECGQGDQASRFDDPKTPEEAQALARERQAVDALVSVMAGRGLAPPAGGGLRLRDYVAIASAGNPEVAPRLQLRLAHDGSLLPDPDALSIDFSRCDVDAREYAATHRFVYFKVVPVLDEDAGARPMAKVRMTQYGDDPQRVSRQPLKESWLTHASMVDLESQEVLRALDAGENGQLDITTSIDAAWQGMELGSPRLDDGFAE